MKPYTTDAQRQAAVRRLRHLAWVLDSRFRVPGTRFRFGIDPLLGLLAGPGDAISAAMAGYIVAEAHRLGVPKPIIAKMIRNVAIDFVVGLIPVIGQLADFGIKPNKKNLRLMGIKPWQADTHPPRPATRDPAPPPRARWRPAP